MSLEAAERLKKRKRAGRFFQYLFQFASVFGTFVLFILLLNIFNDCFGLVVVQYEKDPALITGLNGNQVTEKQMADLLKENVSRGLWRRLQNEKPLAQRSKTEILSLLEERVFKPRIKESWNLFNSLTAREQILEYAERHFPEGRLEFRFWFNPSFIGKSQSSVPEKAGIRTALLGSLWMILITLLVALPLGVGAAIYLEEYAQDNPITRLIQVNIYNLAGVPSIIYGLLGLAVFVRLLGPLTSGALMGLGAGDNTNGRTIISAGLTLALLVLPIIIINTQEALRAVPASLRYSSFGLGATRWQTIRHHVLPGSIDRILTGTILAVSRAFGETAPLVVIGASTFIAFDPVNIFSQFTTLPIQIYQWTARPQGEFKHIAAAAILVLLILLLGMNASAIILRNKFARKRRDQ